MSFCCLSYADTLMKCSIALVLFCLNKPNLRDTLCVIEQQSFVPVVTELQSLTITMLLLVHRTVSI